MAILDGNQLFHKASGRVGEYILRQRNGKTVVYRRPVSKTNWAPTPGQAKNREKFKNANAYGLKAHSDPFLQNYYTSMRKKKHQTVQLIAIRDFRIAPTVEDIEFDFQWKERPTSIRVKAHDDTQVVQLEVSVFDKYGQEIISGRATPVYHQGYWEFDAGQLPPTDGCYRVEAIAKDMPGNTGTLSALFEGK